MQVWKRIAVTTLLCSLTTMPSFGTEFEPLSIPELARIFGVGFGPGYHARPCNPLRATYYNRVTQGAPPFGRSDLSLLSYEHTHPNFSWRFPINGHRGYDYGENGNSDSSEMMPPPYRNEDQNTPQDDADTEGNLALPPGEEKLTPPSESVGRQPDDSDQTGAGLNSWPPKTRFETAPNSVTPSPSDESRYLLPAYPSSSRRPLTYPQSTNSRRPPTQASSGQTPSHPDPVWVRNLAAPPMLAFPPPAPFYVQQNVPPRPPRMTSGPSRLPAHPRGPRQPARTANAPVEFLWH
jgi:hypothetical protein